MSDSRRERPDTEDDEPLETIVAGVTTGLILTVAFGLLALGVPWFWVAFPVGFGGLLPAAMGAVKLYERRQATQQTPTAVEQDALETLRDRYARGEIGDAEFEHRVGALLETESVPDAVDYVEREQTREQ